MGTTSDNTKAIIYQMMWMHGFSYNEALKHVEDMLTEACLNLGIDINNQLKEN